MNATSDTPRRLLATLSLAGCAVASPFSASGSRDVADAVAKCGGTTAVVGITYAELDTSKRRPFEENATRIVDDLHQHPGFIGSSIRTRVLGHEVWTMSAWCSDADLDAFVASSSHQRGIREGMPSVTGLRFARVTVRREEIPISWDRALEILRERGSTRGH